MSTKRKILMNVLVLSMMVLPRVLPLADFGNVFCDIKGVADKIAFFGAIAGLMFYGVLKVWSIIFPESAGQARNYIKDMALGLIIFGFSYQIVNYIFSSVLKLEIGGADC